MLACFRPVLNRSHSGKNAPSTLPSAKSRLAAMDLMYLPDTYQSNYYNYEEERILWGPNKSTSKVAEKPRHRQSSGSKDHKDCPMCKANRRRQLNNYIRSKSRQDSESTIEEEEEEPQEQQK
ncbi:uncharacterized protein LOC132194491 [Neocloeon triangulifer]|uniref:uncharacterized protein LOC132194491 n=1 Tax=Neocloeon triangulifer TaxID=2078957 RepID=UPI00286F7050|nr:uncharacterized protein LOC132194491 [Neocloeon triangulifer]